MHCLQRSAPWMWSTLALTLCGSLVSGCSAGGGPSDTPQADVPADGLMRTANGQIIAGPSPGTGTGTSSGLAPLPAPSDPGSSPTGVEGQGSESFGGSDIALDVPRDAGPGPVDVPAAEPPNEDDDDDDDD